MYKYAIWVRINDYQTANTFVWANNDYEAKMLADLTRIQQQQQLQQARLPPPSP